jgi:hypothetical protein
MKSLIPWVEVTGIVEWVETKRDTKVKVAPGFRQTHTTVTEERLMRLSCGHHEKVYLVEGKKRRKCSACWWDSPEGKLHYSEWLASRTGPAQPVDLPD